MKVYYLVFVLFAACQHVNKETRSSSTGADTLHQSKNNNPPVTTTTVPPTPDKDSNKSNSGTGKVMKPPKVHITPSDSSDVQLSDNPKH